MENIEHVENSNKTNADDAELKLRALERNQNSGTSGDSALPADTEQHAAVDTSQEWWNKKDEKPQPTLLDRAKEAAVIGAAGVILIGGSLLAGHEIMENNPGADVPNQDVNQTQVIEQPASSQSQFVESNQQYTLNPDTLEATPSAQADSPAEAGWWHAVPEHSQHDLTYKGGNTEYGCVPTSTSMVLDYWNQKDASHPTLTAQELLDTNAAQGEFNKYGMSSSNIHDELDKLGYVSQDHVDSNLEELKGAVAEGPVVAIVKLNMKTDGTNHSVVVTGVSDNNEVRVNDPWTGKSQTYSWEQFSKSWGADFGKDAPRNSFTTIRSKSM